MKRKVDLIMEESYINTIDGRLRYCDAIDFVCNHCNYSNEETCKACPVSKTFNDRFPFCEARQTESSNDPKYIATEPEVKVIYETGLMETEILGSGTSYSREFRTKNAEEAFREYKKSGRNYLYRYTYIPNQPRIMEWWDWLEKCWRTD